MAATHPHLRGGKVELGGPTSSGVGDGVAARLEVHGPGVLTASELLALVLGTGDGGHRAVGVAEAVLASVEGSLRRLSRAGCAELGAVRGVGPGSGVRLVAALELGRRAACEPAVEEGHVRGPRDVHLRMGPRLRHLLQEEFHVLLLDARHRVTREHLVTRGTVDTSLIHPREVFRRAVVEAAWGIILVHNHPSGDPTPSPDDRAVTRQLVDAGRTVGIGVLDHVIVGDGRYASFVEEGLM